MTLFRDDDDWLLCRFIIGGRAWPLPLPAPLPLPLVLARGELGMVVTCGEIILAAAEG